MLEGRRRRRRRQRLRLRQHSVTVRSARRIRYITGDLQFALLAWALDAFNEWLYLPCSALPFTRPSTTASPLQLLPYTHTDSYTLAWLACVHTEMSFLIIYVYIYL